MKSELNCQRIEEITLACLFKNDEIVEGNPKEGLEMLIGNGIMNKCGFHKERLTEYTEELKGMLRLLPKNLSKGLSFLDLCVDRAGNQWGEHRNMDQLFTLTNALSLTGYPLPRESWKALPGGMPYIILLVTL